MAEQLSHWAKVGSEVEAIALLELRRRRRTRQDLLERGDYDQLSADEQALVRTAWEQMDQRLATSDVAADKHAGAGHPSEVELVAEAVEAGYRVHLRVLVVPDGVGDIVETSIEWDLMSDPRWLDDDEQRAWRRLAAVILKLPSELERQLS